MRALQIYASNTVGHKTPASVSLLTPGPQPKQAHQGPSRCSDGSTSSGSGNSTGVLNSITSSRRSSGFQVSGQSSPLPQATLGQVKAGKSSPPSSSKHTAGVIGTMSPSHQHIEALHQQRQQQQQQQQECSSTGSTGSERLVYSHSCGRVRLHNVRVQNLGVDWASPRNVYWKHQVRGRGGLGLTPQHVLFHSGSTR